ncbi:hypothetical protein A3SI_02131 [Nitritalea halalkaliphila LW7]|uniref:Uncharacterized protein n=1 Tax=Nitritalea halalkaliphila LW7 TaxID=1189621 RepID=I5CAF5_9BACT|nr:hypothetical protein [Nitritalea halalkaliphila]EIM78807.1 hypothetical protein A3SI_02131 [Nitritalea halalkaliphila LW7]
MTEYILTFFFILALSMVKFVAGPALGLAAGYSVLEVILVTFLGMMSSVLLITQLGQWYKRWRATRPKPRLFSKKARLIIRVWRSFGPNGIAFLTPVFLTPIGGTLVMNALGVTKKKIYLTMSVSALAWATFFALSFDLLIQIPLIAALMPSF